MHAVFPQTPPFSTGARLPSLAHPLAHFPRRRGASSPRPSSTKKPTPTTIHDLVAADQLRHTHRH